MASALLDQLGLNGPPPAGGAAPADASQLPPSMPDPQPHLAADPASGPGDPAGGATGPDPAPVDNVDHAATTEVDTLQQLLGLGHDYMSIPTVQPDEKHKMAKAITVITDLLAGNQRTRDSITGANPALRKLPGASGA